jgi:hypothetical protein
MRIRQVKPDYWSDSVIADMPDSVRLFYIMLWMEADDAGWLRWDASAMGLHLYPFAARSWRERKVSQMIEPLVASGRVERMTDCHHLLIPRLSEHQRLAAPEKRVLTIKREHERHCVLREIAPSPRVPADTREPPLIPETERNGTVRNGTERRDVARAPARAERGALRTQLGDFEDMIRQQREQADV